MGVQFNIKLHTLQARQAEFSAHMDRGARLLPRQAAIHTLMCAGPPTHMGSPAWGSYLKTCGLSRTKGRSPQSQLKQTDTWDLWGPCFPHHTTMLRSRSTGGNWSQQAPFTLHRQT